MDERWVQRYYFFLNPPNFKGINLQKIFKVDHKSPFTECGLY